MSDRDVEHAGWAIAGSPVRRRRNPVLGVLAAVLLVAGLCAAVGGLVRAAAHAAPSDDEIVASGVAAGLGRPDARPATFAAAGRSMTVWLRLDGVRRSVHDQVVGSVACEVARADGTRVAFRGSFQGTSLKVERLATVGVFHARPGRTVVACRQLPFGRRGRIGRLGSDKPFIVVYGRPSERAAPMLWLVGGVALALLAVPVGLRWRRGRLAHVQDRGGPPPGRPSQ